MKTVISAENENALKAAEHIRRTLRDKPDAVLALTAGRSTEKLYSLLSGMCADGEISFSRARIFAVAELVGADKEKSLREKLENELISRIDINKENVFFPDADDCAGYEEQIARVNGIDLAVLGIGMNGHIGYNEPGTQFETFTRVQKLTKSTRRELGAGCENVERAVTMGIKTLMCAKDIIVLAAGEEKADIVFKAVYGRTDSLIPAAFLQIPLQVTLYLDTCAVEKL